MFQTLAAVIIGFGCSTSPAVVTNSWISPSSGNWEDLSWSLGAPPASGQAVMLTNQGWKAIAVTPKTAQAFPQTLSVYSITVASPTNSFNELLLNYLGFDTPLSLSGGLFIESNSTVVALQSGLHLPSTTGFNGLVVGGTFIQGDAAQVSADVVAVGDLGAGIYYLTNGTLAVATTQYVGGTFNGTFNQFGGSNSTKVLRVQQGSLYNLYGGAFAGSITIESGDFHQLQGTVEVNNDLSLVQGSYTLDGGILTTPGMQLPGAEGPINGPSSFAQHGGTNNCATSLGIGTGAPRVGQALGSYILSGGALEVPGMEVGLSGSFNQSGGSCGVRGGMSVTGAERALDYWLWGNATLSGGNLSADNLSISIGDFTQSGGTNRLGGLSLGPSPVHCIYTLSGGFLMTSNTTVAQDDLFGYTFAGGFLQAGGDHQIANTLRISGRTKGFFGYVLSGGQLSAQNLQVDSGAIFQQSGGSLSLPGLFTLANGTWLCNTGRQQLGQFSLGASQGGASTFFLPPSSCTVSFSDSSAVDWSNSAILTVENWNGFLVGGGQHQIFFGTSSSGLSLQQLGQIQFHNPNGVPGVYPATILNTGEIVPARLVEIQRGSGQVVLQWAKPMMLQSATNVSGPYRDVGGSSTGYVIDVNVPNRFFRLRQ